MKATLALLPAVLALLVGASPAYAWTWPVDGPVLKPFSLGANPYAAGQHRGIDVAAPSGSPVRAPAGGTVTFAGTVPQGGRTLTIRTADGYAVTLVHLGAVAVAKGASLAEADVVATIGPSGDSEHAEPYVHLGIRIASDPEGYVDPLSLLPPQRSSAPQRGSPAANSGAVVEPRAGAPGEAPRAAAEAPLQADSTSRGAPADAVATSSPHEVPGEPADEEAGRAGAGTRLAEPAALPGVPVAAAEAAGDGEAASAPPLADKTASEPVPLGRSAETISGRSSGRRGSGGQGTGAEATATMRDAPRLDRAVAPGGAGFRTSAQRWNEEGYLPPAARPRGNRGDGSGRGGYLFALFALAAALTSGVGALALARWARRRGPADTDAPAAGPSVPRGAHREGVDPAPLAACPPPAPASAAAETEEMVVASLLAAPECPPRPRRRRDVHGLAATRAFAREGRGDSGEARRARRRAARVRGGRG